MLLDRYLPQYDVTETHAVIVDATRASHGRRSGGATCPGPR